MIREEIKEVVEKAAREAGFRAATGVKIDRPEDPAHGDYATGFALQIAKTFQMEPKYIADNLKSHILSLRPELFEKVEVAGPGFINFFVSKGYLQKQVEDILKKKEDFARLETGKKQKTNIEFISANPTGSLHIGNGRSAFFGDVLANVLEKAGYRVAREYFINDARGSGQIRELGKTALGKGTTYLNDCLKAKIEELRPKLEKVQDEAEAGAILAEAVQKNNKEFIEKTLRVRFDKWVSEEKEIYGKDKTKKIFDWLQKKDLVYQKEGAWWLKTSQFGDDKDWVVIRETGEPTYLLSDIAYHKDKIDRGFQKIIDIWGADHQAHVSKIKAAAKMLDYQGDLDILILQLVTLKGKERLSKRKGGAVTLADLVEEIGLDAARFFYLQKSLDTHMEIDLTLAKEQSGKNPVYYVQYAHARICSILKKIPKHKLQITNKFQNPNYKLLNHPSELALIKQLIKFPEIVEDTAKDYQLQRLPQYAVSLAAVFHQFYRDCQVISDSKNLTESRSALALAVKTVLETTLKLMGVSAPEKM